MFIKSARSRTSSLERYVFVSITILLLAALIVAIALQIGLWRKTQTRIGPFWEEPGTHLVIIPVGDPPPNWPFDSGGDTVEDDERSNLELSVNGEVWHAGHTLHDRLRGGATRAYSHWGDTLFLRLPAEIKNDSSAKIKTTYSVYMQSWITLVILLIYFMFAAVAESKIGIYTHVISKIRSQRAFVAAADVAYRVGLYLFYAASWALGIGVLVYVATIVGGYVRHYALPTTAVFDDVPFSRRLPAFTPFLGWGLLAVAAIGSAVGWIRQGFDDPESGVTEARIMRYWRFAALPVIFFVLVFAMSGSGWIGTYSPLEINYMSFGGLVPHSDAIGYFLGVMQFGDSGLWGGNGAQRPFAFANRDLTVLMGGLSYTGTLLAQAGLLTLAIGFCLRILVAWRGLWVGVAFAALAFGLIRPFLLTTMTEPLGFCWAFFSAAFFAEALRQRSVSLAVVALTALTCALLTRMGSMFSIPILLIYVGYAFADCWSKRLSISVILIVSVSAVFFLNWLLARLFLQPGISVGGNFSYTICGLSYGHDWTFCRDKFVTGRSDLPTMAAVSKVLGKAAWDQFLLDPLLLVRTALYNMKSYLEGLPRLLLSQYVSIAPISAMFYWMALVLPIPGWLWISRRPDGRRVLWFALALVVSTALSAGIVYADDGRRVMSVTNVFIAMLFALGFAAPGSAPGIDDRPKISARSGTGSIVAVLLTLLLAQPVVLFAMRTARAQPPGVTPKGPEESLVVATRMVTGFLVLPDTDPLPRDTPAFHFSDFKNMTSVFDVEPPPRLVSVVPPPPFAMLATIPLNYVEYATFITPPEVLTNKGVKHWLLSKESRPAAYSVRVMTDTKPID